MCMGRKRYALQAGEDAGRRVLKDVAYFGGVYSGKENGALWEGVRKYIEI